MDYFTNPFVLSLIVSIIGVGITYVYLKKNLEHPDDGVDKMACLKSGLLVFTTTLLATGYLSYTNTQKEVATLTTEFFETGQPQF